MINKNIEKTLFILYNQYKLLTNEVQNVYPNIERITGRNKKIYGA